MNPKYLNYLYIDSLQALCCLNAKKMYFVNSLIFVMKQWKVNKKVFLIHFKGRYFDILMTFPTTTAKILITPLKKH